MNRDTSHTIEQLSYRIEKADFESALAFYIENRQQIPITKRRFYFACIRDGLSGYNAHRRIVRTAIVMLIINVLIHPMFQLELLDLFAFVSQRYLYYNYVCAWVPVILNFLLAVNLILQWRVWVVWPRKLFHQQIPGWSTAAFLLVIMLLSASVLFRGVPLSRDLPTVMGGEYNTCIYTQEEENERLKRFVGEILRGEALAENSTLFLSSSRRGVREVYLINIKSEGKKYTMSKLQFNATTYNRRIYPILIKYLPESEIVLQIENQ